MHRTPTLDPERTDQLRTFLVTEAAADAATSPARRPHRVRFAVGLAAAVLLAGAITVGTSLSGTGTERADAVAIERADGWTTVRIVDVNADPEAVVEELLAAGIDARVDDANQLGTNIDGSGISGLSAEAADGSFGVGVISAMPPADGSTEAPTEAPAEGPGVATGGGVIASTPTPTGPIAGGDGAEMPAEDAAALDQQLEEAGIRFNDPFEISIRNDAGVRVLVYGG